MVSFGEPARLALLVVPALAAVAAVVRHRMRLAQQRALASPSVWEQVMGGTPSTGLARLLAWCGAAALVVLALARPQWGEVPSEVSIRTRDVVIAVDLSDSMRCEDVTPSRLDRGLAVLRRALPGLDGNRVGVVTFAGDAYPLVPLTVDLDAVATFLSGVKPGMIALPGSNLERAVDQGLELLPPEGEGRVMVVISDGENLQGDLEAATGRLKDAGVSLLAVLTGTPRGGPIPVGGDGGGVHYKRDRSGQMVITRARPEVLRRLAAATGGTVVDAGKAGASRKLVEAIRSLQTREAESRRRVRRVERFPLFLVGAAALLALGFLLSPWRRLAAAGLLILAVTGTAGAQTPAQEPGGGGEQAAAQGTVAPGVEVPLWQRLIPGGERRMARRGLALWKKKDLEGAAEAFGGAASLDPEDPERLYDLGTVLGAQGKLEAGAPLLEKAARGGLPRAAYNLGTAALEAGNAAEAVRWLRQALLELPEDPGVKRNYELALRLQQEQQQQHQQKKKDEAERQKDRKDEGKQQQEQQQGSRQGATPTPTPTPAPGQPQRERPPQRTEPLYGALERAEQQAREAMRTPVPATRTRVEKDW